MLYKNREYPLAYYKEKIIKIDQLHSLFHCIGNIPYICLNAILYLVKHVLEIRVSLIFIINALVAKTIRYLTEENGSSDCHSSTKMNCLVLILSFSKK